jgi:hypothetical protein
MAEKKKAIEFYKKCKLVNRILKVYAFIAIALLFTCVCVVGYSVNESNVPNYLKGLYDNLYLIGL